MSKQKRKLIKHLKKMEKINNLLQDATEQGSTEWHYHETIDDEIFECLTELGD